ncbi:JAB N-terminal domain-containing protein [Amycolatopsis sp. NPDC048633]|uniref:JAB N-terminal domain-containing protein n=1 Tax=Amycolatopsis sp. NPDC048633 TaxID=3157095 RepID=UPI0033D9AE40
MAVELAIYRTDDYVPYTRLPILPILRAVFEPVLKQSLAGCRFILRVLPIADSAALGDAPELVNLRSSHGYLHVRIMRAGEVIYQHPHPISEVVGRPLRTLLADRDPDETNWGYVIDGPTLSSLRLTRPTPAVSGVMRIDAKPGRALFDLHEIEQPLPPEISLAELGLAPPGGSHPVSVLVPEEIHSGFTSGIEFDEDVEDGGFLVGKVYRLADPVDHLVVRVSQVVPAERTGASMFHFTFTGESFLRINDQISQRDDGQQLVGWYHTHLFPATEHLGLSSIDVALHTSTFRRPWQIAALVNLSKTGRTLRFYAAHHGSVALTSYQVTR